jgi:hypothetical protein
VTTLQSRRLRRKSDDVVHGQEGHFGVVEMEARKENIRDRSLQMVRTLS